MTRATIERCVEIFDRLRARVGSTSAMEQVIEFAGVPSRRRRIEAEADSLEPHVLAVIEAVARSHGYDLNSIRGITRHDAAVRSEAIHVARAVTGVTYCELACFFGRDRSSLIKTLRRFEKRIARDEILAARLARATGKSVASAEAA